MKFKDLKPGMVLADKTSQFRYFFIRKMGSKRAKIVGLMWTWNGLSMETFKLDSREWNLLGYHINFKEVIDLNTHSIIINTFNDPLEKL